MCKQFQDFGAEGRKAMVELTDFGKRSRIQVNMIYSRKCCFCLPIYINTNHAYNLQEVSASR